MIRYSKYILFSFMTITLLCGCAGEKRETEVQKESSSAAEFEGPDNFFKEALNTLDKDFESTTNSLNNAYSFVEGLYVEGDTLNRSFIDFALQEIDTLRRELEEMQSLTRQKMLEKFVDVDASIAAYHLAIVKDLYDSGDESTEGLERMRRAIMRFENAMAYDNYMLTEEEQQAIESVKSKIANTETADPELRKNLMQILSEINENMKAPGAKGWK